MEDLLEWLEGVPVGLKLNRPLVLLLSAFFKYHVMLWKGAWCEGGVRGVWEGLGGFKGGVGGKGGLRVV